MVHFSTKQDQLNSIIQTLEVSLPTELDQYAEELQDLHFDVDDYDSSPDTDDGPTPLSAGLICMYTLIAQQRYSVSQFHTGPLQKADRAPGPICHNKANPFLWLENGAGEHDASLQCGYSIGALIAWTKQTVCGLLELNKEVMQFALEAERQSASAWVQRTTRVEEWGKGWLVVDGTHILLAWKPGMMSQEHFSYKGFYSMKVALVILSHSLCIVESVVGQPGSVQDLKVWTSGSNILKKPQLYLDEGEFIWVDGGYGHSAFMVRPFSHIAAEKSRGLRFFNHSLSQVWVQVEHAIAYLKNRFQCLNRYRGNMYHIKDHMTTARTIHACIATHTFASQYDGPDMVAELLHPSFSKKVVHDVVETLSTNPNQSGDMQSQWQANQAQYEEESMVSTQSMIQPALTWHHSSLAHDLQEQMFQALFTSTGRQQEGTTTCTRHHERMAEDYNAMLARGWLSRQCRQLSTPSHP
ncbi:uncharacterized protein UBRO_20861 [Ustilago bromivora]|uniref:DDE Tnp4 domain-containing protein n=1 Tax=Ustilago bromivora TaxID=307758 RepID=A0A1K0GAH3_9BASI|nr:uncharacterized protein UBRO_20861 [Ustilago bromivora]